MVAYANPSPALPTPSHPMATTGYGKRPAGDEDPHADADFAHLLPRDAEVAVFIDHLDTGHAMGHKVLAAEHPRYGQQAMRTSLTRITEAGHLRWIREHITVEDNTMRWVTRTYWSRTRRSPEWWAQFARERHGMDVRSSLPRRMTGGSSAGTRHCCRGEPSRSSRQAFWRSAGTSVRRRRCCTGR